MNVKLKTIPNQPQLMYQSLSLLPYQVNGGVRASVKPWVRNPLSSEQEQRGRRGSTSVSCVHLAVCFVIKKMNVGDANVICRVTFLRMREGNLMHMRSRGMQDVREMNKSKKK